MNLDGFIERAMKPGPESLAGRVLEKRFARELKTYFKKLGSDILAMKLEDLAGAGTTEAIARHQVAMRIQRANRVNQPVLLGILRHHIEAGHFAGQKQDVVQEAEDQKKPADKLGQTGQDAADYAAESAGELITGLEQTTIDDIADAVATGIEDRLGVPETAGLIKDIVDGMSTVRAETIAATEMADAFGEAMLEKIGDLGFEYKRLVLSEDACPICEENADADPLPVDDDYPSGDQRPPFHPNCRCAIVAARGPDESDS